MSVSISSCCRYNSCGFAYFTCLNCTNNPICAGVIPVDLQQLLAQVQLYQPYHLLSGHKTWCCVCSLQVCSASNVLNQVKGHVYLATHYRLGNLQWQSLNNYGCKYCEQHCLLSNQWLQSACNQDSCDNNSSNCNTICRPAWIELAHYSGSVGLCSVCWARPVQRANGCCCWIAEFSSKAGGNLLCSIIQTQTYCWAAGQRCHQYAQRQQCSKCAAGLTITNINQALSTIGLPEVSVIECMYIVPFCIARFTFSWVKDTISALLKAQICQSRHVSLCS